MRRHEPGPRVDASQVKMICASLPPRHGRECSRQGNTPQCIDRIVDEDPQITARAEIGKTLSKEEQSCRRQAQPLQQRAIPHEGHRQVWVRLKRRIVITQ